MDEIDVKDCVLKLECSDQGSDADLPDGDLAQLDDISKIVSADSELRVTSSPQFTKCSTQFTKMEDKLEIMNRKLDKILTYFNDHSEVIEILCSKGTPQTHDQHQLIVADGEVTNVPTRSVYTIPHPTPSGPNDASQTPSVPSDAPQTQFVSSDASQSLSVPIGEPKIPSVPDCAFQNVSMPSDVTRTSYVTNDVSLAPSVPDYAPKPPPAVLCVPSQPGSSADFPVSQSDMHSTCTSLPQTSQVLSGNMVQEGSPMKTKKFVARSNRGSSRNQYAWLQARKIFPRETLLTSNSRGISRSGCDKKALDPLTMATIRQKTFLFWPLQKYEDQHKAWRACEKAIDSRIRQLRKLKPSLPKNTRGLSRNRYAWQQAQKIFPRETLLKSNSRGTSQSGCKKDPLDPVKMAKIRQKTFLLWPLQKGEGHFKAWRACEKAIDAGIIKLQTSSVTTDAPQSPSMLSDVFQTPSQPTDSSETPYMPTVATQAPSVPSDPSHVSSALSSVPSHQGSSTHFLVSQSNIHTPLPQPSQVPSSSMEGSPTKTEKVEVGHDKGASRNNYAWLQAQKTFPLETLLISNSRGISRRGYNKNPLDPVKMAAICQKTFDVWPLQTGEDHYKAWRACEKTIDTGIRNIRKLQTSPETPGERQMQSLPIAAPQISNPSVHDDESQAPSVISSLPPQPGSSTAFPVSQSNIHTPSASLQHQSQVQSSNIVKEVSKRKKKNNVARHNKGSSRNHYAMATTTKDLFT